MLDEGSRALLAAVNGMCERGGFKIIEEGELVRACRLDAETMRQTMALLAEKKLIELRYAEDGTYCVRPLPAGKGYLAREAQEARERGKMHREAFLFGAGGAVLGGALSALFAFVLALLLHV